MEPQQLPRVDDLRAPPTVGETYLVRCVEAQIAGERSLYPILGPLHEDAAFIKFPEEHWHLDRRFLTEPQGRLLATHKNADLGERMLARLLPVEHLMAALHAVVLCKDARLRGPLHRPLVCLREQPEYFSANAHQWLAELEAAFAGATVRDHRCPHKGMPLGSLPVDKGCITCPAHGLRFDSEGHLAPRTPDEWQAIRMIAERLRWAQGRP